MSAFNSDTRQSQTSNNLASFIWSVADLLRGDFKQSQYGRIILPFTLLRRLECVLEESKDAVVEEAQKISAMGLNEEAEAKFLLRKTNGLAFYNTSPMTLAKMGQSDIEANLSHYVQSFSKDAREIFSHFKFKISPSLIPVCNAVIIIGLYYMWENKDDKEDSNIDIISR